MTASPTGPLAELFSGRPVLLAPMAGVTEAPFRALCKRHGASLTYTEMVSAKGMLYNPNSAASRTLLAVDPDEVPCALQVYGADPQIMAEQTALMIQRFPGAFCLVDINMGCPVGKVVNRGEGSGLMRTPDLAARVVAAVAEAVEIPVTVKIRSGWDSSEINAPEFARAMQEAGASAVAVHGRTRAQAYKGRSDWGIVAAVKQAVSVPVIGSGDVFSADDVLAMFQQTGADAVMVARGSQGNPWIFREARSLLDQGVPHEPPTWWERIDMAREHSAALAGFAGDRSFIRMRKHVAWYISEMPGATAVRAQVNVCKSYRELDDLLVAYRERLESV